MSPVNADTARSMRGIVQVAVLAAVSLTVLGMMLVVGGVLVTGLFMPGAVLITIGMVAFAVAGVLHVRAADDSNMDHAPGGRGAPQRG